MPLFKKRRDEAAPDAEPTKAGVVVQPRLVPSDLAPGTEVAGYRIHGVLGRGGMGVVYRAEHIHLGRAVALKLLAPGLAGDFRARFVRESRLAASLSHPNIVAVYDAGEADGVLYIAMQLVGGTDLGRLLREEGARDPAEVVRIADQVAAGLDAAHAAGVVHRDVKPGNILVDGDHAWLSDFGLTKRLASSTDLTAKDDIVGTPDYLAPEQIQAASADGRADQYALACVVHYALTGARPFERDSNIAVLQAHLSEPAPRVSELRPELPAEADEILARAMAKDPGERYPSASAFTAALATALGVRRPVEADGSGAAGERGYVLVGVADPATRAVIRAALGRSDSLELVESDDADSTLASAATAAPGLVLLESGLPGRSIADLVREIQAGRTTRVPVVALAARGHDDQWRAALAAGADDILLRPFSAFQLLAKIRDHMPRALER
jgi:serine/threonine-protein kinase